MFLTIFSPFQGAKKEQALYIVSVLDSKFFIYFFVKVGAIPIF